jgi:hypothetical protein
MNYITIVMKSGRKSILKKWYILLNKIRNLIADQHFEMILLLRFNRNYY